MKFVVFLSGGKTRVRWGGAGERYWLRSANYKHFFDLNIEVPVTMKDFPSDLLII